MKEDLSKKLEEAYTILDPQLFELTRISTDTTLTETDRQRMLLERVLLEGMVVMAVYGLDTTRNVTDLLQEVTRERMRLMKDSTNPQAARKDPESILRLSVDTEPEDNGGSH